MKSRFILCLLVGLAYASDSPAFEENTEYTYSVKSRTLSSLHELADQYSGVFYTAELKINLRPDGKLQGAISNPQYAEFHSNLPGGFESYVPESQLSYMPLPLSQKPFQMIMEHGLIKKLVVEREVSNWEVNMIKSIISQLQWDVQGKTALQSPLNDLPSEDKFNGVFKTMEETITGKTETLYEIHPLPSYLLQKENVLDTKLEESDKFVEVIKSKNYTNSEERPSYHYGFGQIKEFEPTSNKMGKFFLRYSLSRALLSGQYSKFDILKAYTVNKIYVNPTFNNKEMGSVISMVNVTLIQLTSKTEQLEDLTNPLEIQNLIYTFENPFNPDNNIHEQNLVPMLEENLSEGGEYVVSQVQPRPMMEQIPNSPLLPYLMGFNGKSIKQNPDFDLKQNIKKIITEMAQEVRSPKEILKQDTLNKFTLLSKLIRIMSKEEILSLADEFYTPDAKGQQRVPWLIFRDAVAETGTGPAFLTIKEWIQTNKIETYEAAQVVATMAHAVRVPTQDFMRQFYELTQDPKIKEQEYLNETAILSFTDLVYKVYVYRNYSHSQFPVHSFGLFYTKEGRDFILSTVIPELTRELNDSISNADTRKIHVYTKALGNIGHRKILEAFEPYLEGRKQVSQFQRLFMVLVLDRVVKEYPTVGSAVCFRIYQNLGELPEIRILAIYQLMRGKPSAEMLQRMAESTNIEPQEQVVAVIKSVMETTSRLESPDYQDLRDAAESAKHLLTDRVGDYSSINIRDFVMDRMNSNAYQKFFAIGSPDSNVPKLVTLAMRGDVNGMYYKTLFFSGLVSSVDELMNVLYRHTKEYEKARSQRSQQKSSDGKYSSANIAEMLNYQGEEREQLEAIIFAEFEQMQKLMSLDNQTLKCLPEVAAEYEDLLKSGLELNYARFWQVEEMALSFPTEMGVPFLYTYEKPLLVRIEGKIKALAKPIISSNNRVQMPEKISAELDGYMTVSNKAQGHLSFVTPFNHKMYRAGFDRSAQVHLPIKAELQVNLNTRQVEIEFELKETNNDIRLLHYSTQPHTSISDLMSISPDTLTPDTYTIKPPVGQHRNFDVVVGKKQTGLALRLFGHHPTQSININELVKILQYDGISTMFERLFDQASLEQTEINLDLVPAQSTVKSVHFSFAMKNMYKQQPTTEKDEEFLSYDKLNSKLKSEEPTKRQEKLMELVSSGIKSAKLRTYEMSLVFKGDRQYQHVFGVTMAKSNAGPKSRAVTYYKTNMDDALYALEFKAYIPNTNGLDLTYSLNSEPRANYNIRLLHGYNGQLSTISSTVNLVRSEARKNYLKEMEPLLQVCREEMQQGNLILPACQNLTVRSNFLDEIKIEMEYENLKREHISYIEGIFKGLRTLYYPMAEVKIVPRQAKLLLRIQFQPEDFRQMNFTVRVNDEETRLFNLTIENYLLRTLLVPHPVFHIQSRLTGALRGWKNFRPTCVIDKTAAQTFSNKTYPLTLDEKFTVVLQYVPQRARLEEKAEVSLQEEMKDSYENYVVLVRELSSNKKEVIITFNHWRTEGKTTEIYLKPKGQGKYSASNPAASVLVDNIERKFNDEEIADLYDGFVEIYALPNGEVKVELNNAFYLIFDGERLKVTATSGKLRDSIFGLCGRFNNDQYEDFTVPARCVLSDPAKFVQSYMLQGRQVRQMYRKQRSDQYEHECVPKVLPLYVDVISEKDIGSQSLTLRPTSPLRTQFVLHKYENGTIYELCFSIRPLPYCFNSAAETTVKRVNVHCMPPSTVTDYFLKVIEQGGSISLSNKPVTTTKLMKIPTRCN